MGSNEDQQRQQSAVDRVNSLINNAQGVYKNTKRAKKTASAARMGGRIAIQATRAAAQAAAATSETWVPILLIVLAVILVVIILVGVITFLFGSTTNAGTPTQCTGTCQATACTGTDIPDPNGTCTNPATPVCCIPEPLPGTLPPLHFFCQYDSKWTKASCNITKYGCTPTSVAMILASFGSSQNPLSTALANGGAGCFDASSAYDFTSWIKSQGYTIGPNLAKSGTTFNISLAMSYISKGYFLLSGANIKYRDSGPLTNLDGGGSHAFVITNVDSSGTATAYDPTMCTSDTNYVSRSFNVKGGYPLLCNSDGCSWYWVLPIKKL